MDGRSESSLLETLAQSPWRTASENEGSKILTSITERHSQRHGLPLDLSSVSNLSAIGARLLQACWSALVRGSCPSCPASLTLLRALHVEAAFLVQLKLLIHGAVRATVFNCRASFRDL